MRRRATDWILDNQRLELWLARRISLLPDDDLRYTSAVAMQTIGGLATKRIIVGPGGVLPADALTAAADGRWMTLRVMVEGSDFASAQIGAPLTPAPVISRRALMELMRNQVIEAVGLANELRAAAIRRQPTAAARLGRAGSLAEAMSRRRAVASA